jgi:hypothetical protein
LAAQRAHPHLHGRSSSGRRSSSSADVSSSQHDPIQASQRHNKLTCCITLRVGILLVLLLCFMQAHQAAALGRQADVKSLLQLLC